ncbi:MAG: BamA/TamA family outer membrane protein [Marinilabiliales bacterium]|nr:BamA/TamA family outer membrane protein [Marinilabiliales bacterium]
MRRNLFMITALLLLVSHFSGVSQESKGKKSSDAGKTGWNFGALPAISFDTDLGFQYGALVNFFDYGNGKKFPGYDHSLYFEASHYTKGSGVYRFYYNSEKLLPGYDLSFDLTYLPDQANDFYGFNGYDAVFMKSWEETSSDNYKTRMFYKFQQKLFRSKLDLQHQIGSSHFKWVAGLNFQNFALASVDIDRLNKNKSDADKLPSVQAQPGLYEKYIDYGILSKQEANGGFVPEIKAGLVYDTRPVRVNPMKGIWTEAVITTAPTFLGAESGFTRIAITHRQYLTIIPEDLSFAYRLGWQQTIGGKVPFYYQSQIVTTVMTGYSTLGLGGSRYLRGARRDRVVGDGVVYGNFELRYKLARMNFIRQKFIWGLNGFMDIGQVTKKIDIPTISLLHENTTDYFNPGAEKLHATYGAGIRLAMNQNFVVALDYGRTLNEQDGDSGLYIGLHYLF